MRINLEKLKRFLSNPTTRTTALLAAVVVAKELGLRISGRKSNIKKLANNIIREIAKHYGKEKR